MMANNDKQRRLFWKRIIANKLAQQKHEQKDSERVVKLVVNLVVKLGHFCQRINSVSGQQNLMSSHKP